MTAKLIAKWLILIVPPFTPLIFALPYELINRDVTVRLLGCGCCPGFNANSFNTILFPGVFVLSALLLIWISRRIANWKKVAYIIVGLIFQAWLTHYSWRMSLWK